VGQRIALPDLDLGLVDQPARGVRHHQLQAQVFALRLQQLIAHAHAREVGVLVGPGLAPGARRVEGAFGHLGQRPARRGQRGPGQGRGGGGHQHGAAAGVVFDGHGPH
jgi:hypothetical protein